MENFTLRITDRKDLRLQTLFDYRSIYSVISEKCCTEIPMPNYIDSCLRDTHRDFKNTILHLLTNNKFVQVKRVVIKHYNDGFTIDSEFLVKREPSLFDLIFKRRYLSSRQLDALNNTTFAAIKANPEPLLTTVDINVINTQTRKD